MADVRWIKIYTDMISNKKIKRIRKLPEGNNIVLIWVFLLAQAGDCNKSGALYLTDTLPFRSEDLAIEFDYDVTVINLALITLERFSMIEVFEDIIFIKNWDEYQNIEGMDKIREQTRLRNIKYREKQKLLLLNDVTVTSHDATELELDLELDLELEKDKKITTTTENPFRLFESEGFGTISQTIGDKLGHMIDEYGERWVCEAMKIAVYRGRRNLGYVDGILKSFQTSGIDQPWLAELPEFKPTIAKAFKKGDTDWDKVLKDMEGVMNGSNQGA